MVIPVGIGNQVNIEELEKAAGDKEKVISATVKEDPKDLMEKIMVKVNGMTRIDNVHFCSCLSFFLS